MTDIFDDIDRPRPRGPAWRYFGGKWRSRNLYPSPTYKTIVEPFAGAANYAWWHGAGRDVVIADRSEDVRSAWSLITSADGAAIIGSAPDLVRGVIVDTQTENPGLRSIMGFWCNLGSASRRRTPTEWSLIKSGWNTMARNRLASDINRVVSRPWTILDEWRSIPDIEATWFIDPPYQRAGKHYKHGSDEIDYASLSEWCKSRRGQVIVCENNGATWLPFVHLEHVKSMSLRCSGNRKSAEAVWSNDEQWMDDLRRKVRDA